MKNMCAILLSAFGTVACAPLAVQPTSEIPALSEQWIAAFNARDMDALMAMYTRDARVLPPNAPMEQGRAAIAASFGELIDAGLSTTLTSVEAVASGDLGYHLGTYTLNAQDGTVIDNGKFIELWRRIDGAWKITHDMFSSDRPAGDAAAATVVFTHEVQDPARWIAAWRGANSRHALFARHGAPRVRLFENPANVRQKALVVDVADMAALEAMLASPEGAKAKAADGVIEESLRMYGPIE